jgi:hypothetical protein
MGSQKKDSQLHQTPIVKSKEQLQDDHEWLLGLLTGVTYTPYAKCHQGCSKVFSRSEILSLQLEYTDHNLIKCNNCTFTAQTFLTSESVRSAAFYSPAWTLKMLKMKREHKLLKLRHADFSDYFSAIYHFGNLNAAFQKAGIDSEVETFPDWKEKIIPALGRLPDAKLAEVLGIKEHDVRKLRLT